MQLRQRAIFASAWTSPRSPIPTTATSCAPTDRMPPCSGATGCCRANTLDRWWGPAHEGSLILSNNARPMPTLMVERAEARPFEHELAELARALALQFRHQPDGIRPRGHRRAAVHGMARRGHAVQGHRVRLLAHRAVLRRAARMQSRVSSGNLLAGNDNVGIDATEENEPGNQMAGFDMRWNSPIGNLPYALYGAVHRRGRVLLYAREVPRAARRRGLEADALTAGCCRPTSSTRPPPARRTPIAVLTTTAPTTRAASTSRDIATTAASSAIPPTAMRRTGRSAATFTHVGRRHCGPPRRARSRLNRDDFGDVRNTVASVPTDYNALELGWKGRLFGEQIDVDLGVESIEPDGGERDVRAVRIHRLATRIRAVSSARVRAPPAACALCVPRRSRRMPIPGSRRATRACAATSSC